MKAAPISHVSNLKAFSVYRFFLLLKADCEIINMVSEEMDKCLLLWLLDKIHLIWFMFPLPSTTVSIVITILSVVISIVSVRLLPI